MGLPKNFDLLVIHATAWRQARGARTKGHDHMALYIRMPVPLRARGIMRHLRPVIR